MRSTKMVTGVLTGTLLLCSWALAQETTALVQGESVSTGEAAGSPSDLSAVADDFAPSTGSDYAPDSYSGEYSVDAYEHAYDDNTQNASCAPSATSHGGVVYETSCPSCNGVGDCYCDLRAPRMERFPGHTTFWNGIHRDYIGRCFSGAHPTACPATWYITGEFVPLFRDQDNSAWQSLGELGPNALDFDDLKTEFDAGFRGTVGRSIGEAFRIEGVYFGNYDWSDQKTIRNRDANSAGGVGNLFSPFSNFGDPPIPGVDFNQLATIRTESSLQSIELNVRRRIITPQRRFHHAETSFLIGARYMQVDELFGYRTVSAQPAGGSINDIDINTENSLLGLQIGLLSQFMVRERIWIDFDLKGGIFRNDVSLNQNYVNTDTAGAVLGTFADAVDHERTTFVGDLSLTANYQVTPAVSFKLGYNAIWISGIAVASENLMSDLNILSLGPAMLDHSGDIVYHGPTAGLTFAY